MRRRSRCALRSLNGTDHHAETRIRRISYGAIEAVKGVSLRSRAARWSPSSAPTARARARCSRASPAWNRSAAASIFDRWQGLHATCRRTSASGSASPCRRKAAACSRTRPCARTCCSAPIRARATGATPRARGSCDRARVQAVPATAGAPGPALRHPVGRRAADARDLPRTDERAAAAAARRALARACAADHQGHLQGHPPAARGRPDHPAGRADGQCRRSASPTAPTCSKPAA